MCHLGECYTWCIVTAVHPDKLIIYPQNYRLHLVSLTTRDTKYKATLFYSNGYKKIPQELSRRRASSVRENTELMVSLTVRGLNYSKRKYLNSLPVISVSIKISELVNINMTGTLFV